jgi:hypothetical protein
MATTVPADAQVWLATLTRTIRVMFPHASFPDGPYERCAAAVAEAAAGDVRASASLTQGFVDLDAAAGGAFTSLDDAAALRELEGTPFFAFVRATVITSLYNDPEVWALLGWPGESYSKGGYLERGFDELPWLPAASVGGNALMAATNGAGAPGEALGRAAQSGNHFPEDDSDVVVVVGSGAGGGTLANELCRQGARVVVLEAGPHLTANDYHQDEWAAFNQMAWLDARTTSGSWRVAKDFPNLPAWTVKAVGGTTTHWAGACPRVKEHEFRAQETYGGGIDGANLLDWPIGLADLAPYYDKAEIKMGVTHVHGRTPLPANTNYTVLADGAGRVGYTDVATGPYATNAEPYDGRPATVQDGFNFQGDKQGSKWSTLVAELPKAAATGNLDLRADATSCRSRSAPTGGPTASSTSTPTARCTARRPRRSAWRPTRSRPRGCCCSRPAAGTRTGWRTPRGRWVATTCAT